MTTFMKNPLLSLMAASLLLFNVACKDDNKTPQSCDALNLSTKETLVRHIGETFAWIQNAMAIHNRPSILPARTDDAALTDIPQTYVATATHIVNKGSHHSIQF
jgi:hypothetical protein